MTTILYDEIIFAYKKRHTKTGPGTIRVGMAQIPCSRVIIEGNISARIIYGTPNRSGTKMPLIIKIFHEPEFDYYDDSLNYDSFPDDLKTEITNIQAFDRAKKERERYREKNPIQKRYRKSEME